MRVDEPVSPVWESRGACGRPICPHTSSTDRGCPVHTQRAFVHNCPQNCAQARSGWAVHRVCTRASIHRFRGENHDVVRICRDTRDPVVHRRRPHSADVNTHRSPVDDCGQLHPHAVYECRSRPWLGSRVVAWSRYPQNMAPQWATLWTARETGEEGSSGSVTSWRHRPAAVDKADDMPLWEGCVRSVRGRRTASRRGSTAGRRSDGRRGISVISDPLRGGWQESPGRDLERDRRGSSELDAGRGGPPGACGATRESPAATPDSDACRGLRPARARGRTVGMCGRFAVRRTRRGLRERPCAGASGATCLVQDRTARCGGEPR